MPTETLAHYLNEKRLQAGLTYETVAQMSNTPEATVKNLCTGKTKNPGWETIIPIMEAVGGSYDEMLYPDKTKDEIKETSVLALKDIYEYQISEIQKTNEEHIHSIRTHYEQHHEDLKENYEKRLADKREIIDLQNAHIQKLEESIKTKTKIIITLSSIFILLFFALLILELLHPEHGWIRF